MREIATYCEGCCRTYSARYNTSTHHIDFACDSCGPLRGYTMPSIHLTTLSADQKRQVQRMLEKTAEADGAPLILPVWLDETVQESLPPVYPVKVTPLQEETQASDTLTAKVVVDVSPLVDSMAAVTDLIEDLVRAFVQACGLPGAEPGKPLDPFKLVPRTPSVGPVYQFRPITTLFPPLPPLGGVGPGPAAGLTTPTTDLAKIERIRKQLDLLRQCQAKKL